MLSSLSELKGYESIIPIEAKEDLADLPEMGICINATSLGLNQNDPLPLDMAFLTPQWAVYDMVYNPQKTQFLFTTSSFTFEHKPSNDRYVEIKRNSFTALATRRRP